MTSAKRITIFAVRRLVLFAIDEEIKKELQRKNSHFMNGGNHFDNTCHKRLKEVRDSVEYVFDLLLEERE